MTVTLFVVIVGMTTPTLLHFGSLDACEKAKAQVSRAAKVYYNSRTNVHEPMAWCLTRGF